MFQSSEKSRYQQVNSFQTSHNKAVTHNMNGNNRMGLKKEWCCKIKCSHHKCCAVERNRWKCTRVKVFEYCGNMFAHTVTSIKIFNK